MAVCKIFSVEKKEITFDDGRTTKGYAITFGARNGKMDSEGKRVIEGFVPFCYATKDGKARADKFVGEKKLLPKNYIPLAGDMVDIEFELGTSEIVTVTKLDKNGQPLPITQ